VTIPKGIELFAGHTLLYVDKQGKSQMKTIGLNVEKVKKAIKDLVKSGDYMIPKEA
jgi:hypothetical protein